jgi:hypothetical protein
MTTKLILAFTVAAFALAGGSLAAPRNAFAEDGKPAATLSNSSADDKDNKDKRRDRGYGYDWRSVYHSYRDRYEPDSRRYRNQDWTSAKHREGDHPRRKAKNDDADRGYDWRSVYRSYRDRHDHDWTDAERRDRDHPRRNRKDDD